MFGFIMEKQKKLGNILEANNLSKQNLIAELETGYCVNTTVF